MPIYEYECSNCKFYVEALQKISEPPLVKCPSCKKQTLKRLVSAPVFRLKGGGWYETDFKSDQEGKRNLAKGEEGEAPAADKPADDKAEKPAEAAQKADKSADKNADKRADKKPAAPPRKAAARKPVRPAAKSKSKSKSKAKPKAAARSVKRRR